MSEEENQDSSTSAAEASSPEETSERGTVYRSGRGKCDDIPYKTFDFRTPIFLTEFESREIESRYETYLEYLAARLALQLKLDCKLTTSHAKTHTYEDFKSQITGLNHITLFNVSNARGIGILAIDSKLGIGIVNRMLGGTGNAGDDQRLLTSIEVSLVEEIVEVMLEEWGSAWKLEGAENGPETNIIGYESDIRFLQTTVYDTMMVSVEVKMTVGDYEGTIHLGLPIALLEPTLKKLRSRAASVSSTEGPRQSKWLPSYSTINVPVFAQLDVASMKVKDILELRPGDVIEIPSELLKETKLRVMNRTCFVGEVGVDNANVVVKINKKVMEQE